MSEADELYEMANLYPRTTGLPMVIWVSERGRARHDVRIKVMPTHGTRMAIDSAATVALRPQPRLVAGQLSAADLAVVGRWLALNQDAVVDYWNGAIDTAELIARLRRLP